MIRARCHHCKRVVEDFILTNRIYANPYLIAICSECYYTEGYDEKDKK